jgi:voltage-gated potassium channel
LRAIGVRLGAALTIILMTVGVVYFDSSGYRDTKGDGVGLLDAFYYAAVTLSTTGYGDITPVSAGARLMNVLVITPARVAFLIILVGTTLEVLTEQSRSLYRLARWREKVRDHIVVCGYGTKGRNAVQAILDNGTERSKIVVVEADPQAARAASAAGLVVVEGSSTRSSVLTEARVERARAVIVATNTDDAAVLTTLTVRDLTKGTVRVVAAVRESENARLIRQSGAQQVVVSSETAGRLLGLSTSAPPIVDVVEDLLTAGEGMALGLRGARREEVGSAPRSLDDLVIALVRRGQVLRLGDLAAAAIATGDLLVIVTDEARSGTDETNARQ